MLLEIMDEFFMADEKTQYELESIRNTISRLRIIHEVIQFKGKTGIAPVRYYLGKQFHKRSQTHNFMSKGITFCTMLPMRSIPFKIICLVGMDWNSYPRHDQETEFDLIRQSPRMGDRSLRDEDKYIFLETILSARKTLYISFVGQSLKDDSRMPPSTVVSDLIEYIKEGFQLETGGNIEDHLITYHKSQSYHHEYFAGKERLYSYSEEAFQVLKALKDQIQTHKAFIQEYLSEPDDSFKIIDVEEFKSFFRNPSKFLLKKRLGINLDEEVSVLIDKEPFDLKGLDRYIVEKDLLEGCLKEKDANEIFAKIKAKGIIPHDPTGRCILEKSSTEISFFAKSLKKYISHQQEKTIDLELKLMDCTITGILENIFGNTCICYRYAKIKATDMLNAWINHLILHLVDVDNPRTVLMGIDRGQETRVMVYLFAPVSSPEEILESLVEIFKTGIRRPIPFFPESSLEFAKLMKKNDENDVINRIKHRFYGDEYRFGEGQDPYYDLCFGGLDPFDEEFKRLSKSIFEPLLKHLNNRV
jgi:exodeoxyribonuclease V gamma subunit